MNEVSLQESCLSYVALWVIEIWDLITVRFPVHDLPQLLVDLKDLSLLCTSSPDLSYVEKCQCLFSHARGFIQRQLTRQDRAQIHMRVMALQHKFDTGTHTDLAPHFPMRCMAMRGTCPYSHTPGDCP